MRIVWNIVVCLILFAAFVAGGAWFGKLIVPKVNAHNDWGATWLMFVFGGGLTGGCLATFLILWWMKRRSDS